MADWTVGELVSTQEWLSELEQAVDRSSDLMHSVPTPLLKELIQATRERDRYREALEKILAEYRADFHLWRARRTRSDASGGRGVRIGPRDLTSEQDWDELKKVLRGPWLNEDGT